MRDISPEFHLDHFAGPMDLLMTLLEQNKIDIYDIPIASISEQYLAFLEDAEAMNLEVASSFLLMAANLVRIKVRMLLPKRKELEEDPRSSLVEQILEYRFVKDVAARLAEQLEKEGQTYPKRTNRKDLRALYQLKKPLLAMEVSALTNAYSGLLSADENNSLSVQALQQEKSIVEIMDKLLRDVYDAGGLTLTSLFENSNNRSAFIGTFLALLECIHNRNVSVSQIKRFGQIWIHPIEDLRYEH